MRTTIDLPDDLHRLASAIARDQGITLSEAVARLLRSALDTSGTASVTTSASTGLRTLRLGRPVTSEDVRSLEDEA